MLKKRPFQNDWFSKNVLNVSNNLELKHISCNNNQLSGLTLSGNTKLSELNIEYNALSTLKINSTGLTYITCNNNKLTKISVDSMLDEIISELDNWELNQHIDLNGEEDEHEEHEIAQEETKEEEFDYSRLSKKQLQDEIDTAIDDGDFDRVHMLSKFLKESIKYKK